MTDPADGTDLDSTCGSCGNPLTDGAACEAGCPDPRTAALDAGAESGPPDL